MQHFGKSNRFGVPAPKPGALPTGPHPDLNCHPLYTMARRNASVKYPTQSCYSFFTLFRKIVIKSNQTKTKGGMNMPGPGGHGGPGGPGGRGGMGGPGGRGGFGGPGRGPGGPGMGGRLGGMGGPGMGGHMPPPRPPRRGWGHRPYGGRGVGCCGCAAPMMVLVVAVIAGLAMLLF